MRSFALIVLLASFAASAAAQEPAATPAEPGREAVERLESLGELETDRDSFTPATSVVGRNRVVVEAAYSFLENRGIKETHSLPELLIRFGVTERLEARLGWNYEVGGVGNSITGVDAGDENPERSRKSLIREHALAYGFKFRLVEQDRFIPRSALIVQGFTPTGSNEEHATATQVVATLVAGWEFANRWRFDTALRYGTESEDGDRFNQWAPSAVLKIPIRETWSIHSEYFAIASSGREVNGVKHYFSPGLHWLVTPNLEVGVRLGWGLNDDSTRFFTNVGFGGRF